MSAQERRQVSQFLRTTRESRNFFHSGVNRNAAYGPLDRLSREDYFLRLEEFGQASELFHAHLTSNQVDETLYPEVSKLRGILRDASFTTFSDFANVVNSDPSSLPMAIRNQVASAISDIQNRQGPARNVFDLEYKNEPEKYFSFMLVRGYSALFARVNGKYSFTPAFTSAFTEVVTNDLPHSALARDIIPKASEIAKEDTETATLRRVVEDGRRNAFSPIDTLETLNDIDAFLQRRGIVLSISALEEAWTLMKNTENIAQYVFALFTSETPEQRNFGEVVLHKYFVAMDALIEMERKDRGGGEIAQRIIEVMDSNCEDGDAFWKLAPWMYDYLKTQISEDEALQRVLLWAKDGHPDEGSSDYHPESLHLAGLAFLRQEPTNGKMYGLNRDPQSISQQFTKALAQRIAKEHFLTDEFDPDKVFI